MRTFRIILIFFALTSFSPAEDEPKGKIHGYTFGDYYFILGNHNSGLKDRNGFWFRRIYLGYDYKISDAFSSRLRLEMNQQDGFIDGEEPAIIVPFVKDAYLKWKAGNHSVIMGLSETPTKRLVEKIWGYRSVEKTPMDLQKMGSSRDLGLAAEGLFDDGGMVKYHVMLGNGSGTKNETHRGKKLSGALSFYPVKEIIIEGLFEYVDNKPGETWTTFQGFAAYKTDAFRVGVQFAQQKRSGVKQTNNKGEDNEETITLDDFDVSLISGFAVVKVSDGLNVLIRVDQMLKLNPSAEEISYIPMSNDAKSLLVIAGLDYSPAKNVHIIPNVEMVSYAKPKDMERLDSDIIARVTFYYVFEKQP